MGTATRIPLKKDMVAPDFQNLPGVDGRFYSLSDFADKKILVIFFSCNHCPTVQAYEDRIKALQQEYKDRNVQFIAINSNDARVVEEDSFENMKKRAQDRHFNFLYLQDESQQVAKSYEATHTPQIYVFNEKRKLSYTGKIDDNWQQPSLVKRQFLKEAIESLLQGQQPREAETFAIGCTIKWKM